MEYVIPPPMPDTMPDDGHVLSAAEAKVILPDAFSATTQHHARFATGYSYVFSDKGALCRFWDNGRSSASSWSYWDPDHNAWREMRYSAWPTIQTIKQKAGGDPYRAAELTSEETRLAALEITDLRRKLDSILMDMGRRFEWAFKCKDEDEFQMGRYDMDPEDIFSFFIMCDW